MKYQIIIKKKIKIYKSKSKIFINIYVINQLLILDLDF